MSSSEDAAAMAAEYTSFLLSNYCSNAAAALYMYEYLITIDYEVELFWKRKFTGASALFILNRYLRLWFYITELMLWAPLSTPSCAALTRFTFVFGLFAYVVWAAFSGLRMFAVSGKNWSLSILVFALSLVPFAVDLVNMRYGITGETLPVYGCSASELTPVSIERRLTIADRTCLMAADCLLILVTWFALSRRTFLSSPNTFAFVLLYDGTIYFVILLILNTLHLAFTLASLVTPALQNASDLIVFVEPITAILVQRFLIHLQLANRKALHLDASQNGNGASSQDMGSLVFERVVGSLGASLTLDDYISSTDVGSEMLKESSGESDAGTGDLDMDDGGGKDSIPLEPKKIGHYLSRRAARHSVGLDMFVECSRSPLWHTQRAKRARAPCHARHQGDFTNMSRPAASSGCTLCLPFKLRIGEVVVAHVRVVASPQY